MQKTFINYKDIIDSYEALNKDFGILPNGLYRGFDSIEKTATGIRLLHNLTGATYTQKDGTQITGIAVIKSPQGVIITESEPIELPISAHSIVGNRIDVVVMEHQRGDIQGGSIAIPSIVQGTFNAGTPVVTDIQFKTIIGYLRVNSDGTYHYTRAFTPALSNFDLREEANKWHKQQTLSINTTPLSIINNSINIDDTANTYYIKALSASLADTQLTYISIHKSELTDTLSVGTEITLINKGSFPIQFLNSAAQLTDDLVAALGVTMPPIGYAFISIPTMTNSFKLQPGGTVKLLEDTITQSISAVDGSIETVTIGIWRIISMIDNFANPFNLATELKNKPWGGNLEFIEAVKEVIINNPIATSTRTSPLSINNSIIQNGLTATHLNTYEVSVQSGVSEIIGVQSAFIIGTRVIFLFTVADTFAIVRQGTDNKSFKSPIGFDYEVRTGSMIECVQMADGLHILNGEPYINWIAPNIQGNNYSILESHPVKFAFYPDGYLRFKGILKITGNNALLSFKLPNTLFRSPLINKNGSFNFASINPHILPITKYHYLLFTEEMTEGFNPIPTGYFIFQINLGALASEEGIAEIDANLLGLQIPYK
jgi:hypothetical protein